MELALDPCSYSGLGTRLMIQLVRIIDLRLRKVRRVEIAFILRGFQYCVTALFQRRSSHATQATID